MSCNVRVQIMNLRGLFCSRMLLRVAVLLWLISAGFVVFLMGKIDAIVHGQLYSYGLQFSLNWAIGYWSYVRLMYLCLVVPGVFGGGALLLSFMHDKESVAKDAAKHEAKPVTVKVKGRKESENKRISCPNCQKVFGKPLTMLDFRTGKAKLINVCPYCNKALPQSTKQKGQVDLVALDNEEELVED